MSEHPLAARIKALIFFRALFISLLLGSAYLFAIEFRNIGHPLAISGFIVSLYVLTIVYALLIRNIPPQHLFLFAYAQLIVDVVAEIVLIALTGGIESTFSFLLILTVLSSSIILNRRAGYIIASIASVLYGILLDLQYYRIIPMRYDSGLGETQFLYIIFVHTAAFFVTAYLGGYLSSRLETTKEKLEEKDAYLRDLEFFNTKIIESLPSGLFTTGPDGGILIFNRAAERIIGIEREHAIGKQAHEIIPFVRNPITTGRYDDVFTNPAGEYKTIGITISGFRDASGKESGFIGIFQDLSEIKRLENEMKRKEQLAAIGALSANIAHEIRNPLAALRGSIEMLREGVIPEKHRTRLMDIAVSEMERLDRIITDFLTYSRPRPLEIRSCDLSALLSDTLELLANAPQAKSGLSISRHLPDRLEVEADPMQLRQVFWNIGINAVEAMSQGGELTVSARSNGEMVSVTFADTGEGIPLDRQKEIFFPFFTTKEKGTGLGLAIAYRIIEEHGGNMRLQSTPGIGTTMEIILRRHGIEAAHPRR